MRQSKGFSCFEMMKISYSQIEFCFREDSLLTGLLLLHWLSRNPKSGFSIGRFLNLEERKTDDRFTFEKNFTDHSIINKIYIPEA